MLPIPAEDKSHSITPSFPPRKCNAHLHAGCIVVKAAFIGIALAVCCVMQRANSTMRIMSSLVTENYPRLGT